MILTPLLLISTGVPARVRIDVLGEGRLRFASGRAVAFASSATLTSNAAGLLADSSGRPVLPHVRVGSSFTVAMNGTIRDAGRVVGRLVLQRTDGEIGFPGQGAFGIVDIDERRNETASTPLPSGLLAPLPGRLFFPGPLVQTGDPLNVAIVGNGFFRVIRADGTPFYTRDGDFLPDASGRLSTAGGLLLDPLVVLPSGVTSISVGPDGTVSAVLPGATSGSVLGKIEVTLFTSPRWLRRLGSDLFVETEESGAAQSSTPGQNGTGTLVGGGVEVRPRE